MLERTEWLDHIVDARPVKSDEMDAASAWGKISARVGPPASHTGK
jgi:hypothetical protein